MEHIKTCKSIRMENMTLTQLKHALELLDSIDKELLAIVAEDEYYGSLEEYCQNACDALDDFLSVYVEYTTGEE